MEASLLLAIVAATPPTIAALAAWWKLAQKTEEIHVLVNANLLRVQRDLASAVTEIGELKETVKSLQPPPRKRR